MMLLCKARRFFFEFKFPILIKLCFDIFSLGYFGYVMWSESGLQSQGSCGKYILSWIIYACMWCIFVNIYKNKNITELSFSNAVLLVLGGASLLPGICLYAKGSFTNHYFMFFCYFWLALTVGSLILARLSFSRQVIKYVSNVRIKYDWAIYYGIVLTGVCLLAYVVCSYNVKLNFYNLISPTNAAVYEQRAYFASIDKPLWLNYALANFPMLNLWCFACFLYNKKFIWLLLALFIQIGLFALDASKVYVFSVISFIGVYTVWPYLSWKRLAVVWCSITMFIFTFGRFNTWTWQIGDLLYRRQMFLPSILSSCYFSFFLKHEPIFLFNKSLYPNLPYMIGEIYFQAPTMSANNGLMAEAVAMWGLLGCVIQPVLLAVFFHLLDIFSARVPSRVSLSLSIFIGTILINSFFKTSLLSHGLLACLLMALCWPREGSEINREGAVRRNVEEDKSV